ncbi:MAG: hypothetical protein ACI8RD_000499 [Bacillariaceae sp.]|jgi:hypothetical protein
MDYMMDGLHDECHTSGKEIEELSEGSTRNTRRSPSVSFITSNQGIENLFVFHQHRRTSIQINNALLKD